MIKKISTQLSLFFPLMFYYFLFHFIWNFFGWLFMSWTLMVNEVYLVMIMDWLGLIKPSMFQIYQWMINGSFVIFWDIDRPPLYQPNLNHLTHRWSLCLYILTYGSILLVMTSFDLLCFHFLLTLWALCFVIYFVH